MIIPGVVAAIHVAGVRGDPCGAVRWTVLIYCWMWGACVGVYQLLIRHSSLY